MKKKMLINKKIHRVESITIIFLVAATILSGYLSNKLYHQNPDNLIKSYAMTILMLLIVWFGIELDKFQVIREVGQRYLFSCGYLTALCIIFLSKKYSIYNLWMVGGVIISAYISVYLGLAVQFIFTYLICSLNNYDIENFLFFFIIGAVMCLLSQYIKKAMTFIYVSIISVSCHVILLFFMNNFIFHESLNIDSLRSVITTILVLLLVFLGFQYGKKWLYWLNEEASQTEKNKTQKIALEKVAVLAEAETYDQIQNKKEGLSDKVTIIRDEYDRILADDYELLVELQKKSKQLYQHSLNIAETAEKAAVLLGCDRRLARAGGLYHEIGKLRSKDYIKAGIQIAKEYRFPEELIHVIGQHNSKYEKPKSKEAAIVMLTESVISTIHYFENEKKKALQEGKTIKEQPLNKIVENILDIRFSKGTLDESGITILEFKKLKAYYIELYS